MFLILIAIVIESDLDNVQAEAVSKTSRKEKERKKYAIWERHEEQGIKLTGGRSNCFCKMLLYFSNVDGNQHKGIIKAAALRVSP